MPDRRHRSNPCHWDSQSGSGQTVIAVNAELWLWQLWEGVLSNEELRAVGRGRNLGSGWSLLGCGSNQVAVPSQPYSGILILTQVLTFWREPQDE